MKWGIDAPKDVETWGTGIRLLEEWCFTDSEDIGKLPAVYRLAFKLMGRIGALRRAHRVLRYQL